MTRKELVKEIAYHTAYNQVQVMTIISHMENRIEAAMMRGESVELTGFGKFEVIETKARQATMTMFGFKEVVDVPAKKLVKFRPGAGLKRAVAG